MAVKFDIIKKSGAWFSYNGNKVGQGRDNIKKYMEDNPEFTADIENQVRNLMMKKQENIVVEMTENSEINEDNFVETDEI